MELIIEKIKQGSHYNEIINYIEELFPVKPEVSNEILKQLIIHLLLNLSIGKVISDIRFIFQEVNNGEFYFGII